MATVANPAFAPERRSSSGAVHRACPWIETEFRNELASWNPDGTEAAGESAPDKQTVIVEVDGKCPEITLPAAFAPVPVRPPARGGSRALARCLTAPMRGTVIKVARVR